MNSGEGRNILIVLANTVAKGIRNFVYAYTPTPIKMTEILKMSYYQPIRIQDSYIRCKLVCNYIYYFENRNLFINLYFAYNVNYFNFVYHAVYIKQV